MQNHHLKDNDDNEITSNRPWVVPHFHQGNVREEGVTRGKPRLSTRASIFTHAPEFRSNNNDDNNNDDDNDDDDDDGDDDYILL